ncbi:methylated-DNA--[protein]-cysteine S-methyltransferase [Sphingomonas radiodurans]|uniref:methylated-DNA--[protein]-cysteine S-methyltransferase n=1 Tax=Sphingomonas radiodurans TaxID=2890321 RepID=UPI001E452B14|nr:methylated-DNA--[protein]-cysteine S-methyltransferase [Sphingomonas radiodurans]WBH15370.1 methylated-DNA--[protein]-cysteine S-methyltransferase [Sphingomonas radiodurans]
MPYATDKIPSPTGDLTLVATDAGLAAILWDDDARMQARYAPRVAAPDHPVIAAATRQLNEYFAGTRTAFDVPLDPTGTEFQRAVWTTLLAIPYGETRSYRDIARAIGRPTATRAVGAANGRNPLPIIAPCHRVIGANGALTGFGGGLPNKQLLLALERRVLTSREAA